MWPHLARALLATSLGGCSLLYNPSNLPPPVDAAADAVPDVPLADTNPALLALTAVKTPGPLLEGQGTGGSAPAILAVGGHHILQGATITVAPTTANASVMLTFGTSVVSVDGDWIALPVTAGVMPTINDGTPAIPLTVTVTQPGASPATLAWSLEALDQLPQNGAAGDATILTPHPRPYSRVDITGNLTIRGSTPGARGLVRSTGLLKIAGTTTAITDLPSPTPSTAVAGGCPGGAGGTVGGCSAPTAGGAATGTAGGGGGGFDGAGTATTAMNHGAPGSGSGDPLIKSFAANVGGGGGGGGGGVAGGGEGGATGGAVELSAGGDMMIGTVTMNGTTGEDPPSLLGGGGGGGGAGGLIIVRAKGTLSTGALSAKGGMGGSTGANAGGNGAPGRIRFDTPTATVPAGTTPTPHRGLMITPISPPITRMRTPSITVTGTPNDTYDLYVINPDDANAKTVSNQTLTQPSSTFATPQLSIGHNTLCVLPAGASLNALEAKNCIELVYLP